MDPVPMEHALRRSMLLIEGQPGRADAMHDVLFDTAIKYTHTGFRVLFFRTARVDRVTDSNRAQFSELFKLITFMYVPTVEEALKRVMDLQRWENCIPGLLIFESLDLLGTERADEDAMPFRRTLLLSAIADTVRTISVVQKGTCNCIVTTSGTRPEAFPSAMFIREHNVLRAADVQSSADILAVMAENEHTINQQLEQESA
uniref:DNA recombination and repair protein Rad51-like C-terminal domain-containing protein n=1 Tax=Anopheles dirus TaxID=7168 RepID=A0A182N0M4_9DIPT